MQTDVDPFVVVGAAAESDGDTGFSALTRGRARLQAAVHASPGPSPFGVTVAKFQGFNLLDQPLVVYAVGGVDCVLPARTTVKLRHAMRGARVLVAHENADIEKPIVIGIVEADSRVSDEPVSLPVVQAEIDGERRVIEAEREIVLRCGDASITLTRAGKVIIRGTYILSRSSGYNRMKGAAIDLN
jgi:hypothetical protein